MSPEDPRATATPRPSREPESASFATARVGVRRTRPPLFVIGFLVVIGALVAVGVGGRETGSAPSAPPVAAVSPGPTIEPAGVTQSPPAVVFRGPSSSPDAAPIITSGPGPIELVARRHPETMFVHGDVFVPRVTWVFVSLQDDDGRVAGWASVSVPGAAGPGVGSGPTLRFDVEVALPDGYDDRLWIQANAYDADGAQIANVRLEVPPDEDAAAMGPVRLAAPSAWNEVVNSETVLVDGRLVIRADSVRIALESDDGRAVAVETLDTANRDGGIRPVRAPTFRLELAVPSPRPEGRLWVVITAYDADGELIASLRRPVVMGEVTLGAGPS